MSQKTTPLVIVENLRVERDRVILSKIDWTMNSNERWVILGANGSGKTSLLSVLTGYLAETRGRVTICGATRGEYDWRELRKRVGLVSNVLIRMIEPDEPALSVVVGGRDAKLNLWIEPTDAERRMAITLMRRTECTKVAKQPWSTLSQGERQRVLIARSLFSGLDVLILDEPCSGLDPVSREHFLKMLDRIGKGPKAVPLVLVTHHVEEITPLFTHVLMIRKGRVLAAGKIGEVLTSENLSALFDAKIKLRKDRHRYTLNVESYRIKKKR
ncbi:MAG: ATP-binding cassette domain-containing protein [Puniceicoccales bacterium]|jgi:iron complex transport system ATP-binding protein|nr:ATP-binding cassette domain-containing protein [Puniceicoccales bacterium]